MTISTQSLAERHVMSLDELMRGRRSVRRFLPDPPERALVEQVLEAGRWAPSPHGSQPWRFVVITRADVKTTLASAMAEAWQRNLAMDGEDADVIASRQQASRNRILETPVLILLCLFVEDLDTYPDSDRQRAETTMAVQSLGASAQNMLLTAYNLGLDMGWMCAPLFCPDVVRDALGLPPSHVPHALLQLGYAAADPKRRPRRPLASLITRWM